MRGSKGRDDDRWHWPHLRRGDGRAAGVSRTFAGAPQLIRDRHDLQPR
jgi:hypothetical protein